MNCPSRSSLILAAIASGCLAGNAIAEKALSADGKLTYYGDLRLRYEADYDSARADGTIRDDRHRARIRARVGLNYELDNHWRAGVRVRTGNHRSQQSSHLTFKTDDGSHDDLDFVVDKYFLAYRNDHYSAWAGRNSFPFWKQNELFWDDDVTPTGLAASMTPGGGDVTLTLGGFMLPDGGYQVHQPMVGGQVRYTLQVGEVMATLAPGFFHFFETDDPANYLLTGNDRRDYAVAALNAQVATELTGVPVTLGVDFYKNFADYSTGVSDPFITPSNKDENFGYVLSARLGSLKEKGDWLLGYYYAHIEQFAVNASYAQDDWIRWGNGPQTRSSNFEGHEIRAAYAVLDTLNIVARWYLVESVKGAEDGNRFRLDVNFSF